MQINKNKLNWIQLDITARCQAMCLECARNIDGKDVNPFIGKPHSWDMPLDVIKKAVTPEMLSNNLQKILFNGNFGDPCIHPQFLDICQYIVDHAHKDLRLNISTNGAMFDSEYWTKVGDVLKNITHGVIFGIDGLADTHHIYRRNTKYENVINNVKAFIDAGGHADWQYIVFDHNKHQVEEAKQIAKEIGFNSIFFRGLTTGSGAARNFTKAVNKHKDGGMGAKTKKNNEVVVHIDGRKGYQEAKKIVGEAPKDFLDTANISCQYYNSKGMYVEYDGTVWMCCWTGDMHKRKNQLFGMDKISQEWKHITKRFGKHFNNLHYHSFDDILNHEFFVSYLDKTFNSTRNDPDTPRLDTCAKTCVWGKNFV
tara:strand:- start:15414 stop:16517 length:1104 start_codon:yes stop_codon:yes gene_type:complete